MQMVDEKNKRPFRVVVVGAGIAGLTLSNALQRAGIDHVVLEKHKQVVHASGASIGIWPNGSRLLAQLGCLDSIKKACSKMKVSYTRNSDGKAFITSKLFDEISKRHGYEFFLLERMEFIRALYNGLPSRTPIKTGCAVKSISESVDGVRVFLEDGSHEDGDIVVGCDGVASSVRKIMWDHANEAVPNTITTKEMQSLKVNYKCLVGLSPAIAQLPSGSMTVVHNNGFSFLIMTQPQLTFFFVFKKLDQTHYWPNFPKYSRKDIETEASLLVDLHVNDDVLFGEIWNNRLRGDLINVEEGIFQHWHSGRSVLVGDSAHKFTPNIAFGGNCAMESVATLANLIKAKLETSPHGLFSHPSQEELSAIFQTYQGQRLPRAQEISWLSTFNTRVQACENACFNFIAKYCFPLATDGMVGGLFAATVKKGVKLDYVPLVGQPEGTVPWEDEKRLRDFPSQKSAYWKTVLTLGMLVVLCVIFGVRF
ncbi:hypothetical protein BCR34DRAFT_617773 [Clohesyomyces aquaticus]|uniref:FAD-binding domain-containing protein n=1 Tax=Clohesyomyces aquaticus TaxID=1231657 RepID=A0A1Y1Z032_9PLEO|nr:hypothetical protein BCR34DRAFT_617773 [Clohesyomyces aquaticus]